MKHKRTLLSLFIVLCHPTWSRAQAWSGIISSGRAIDWSTAGIPGGIPARPTVCTNWYNGSGVPGSGTGNNGDYYFRIDVGHASAEYKKASGAWATTGNEFYADVNTALGACGSGNVVYLNAGTYYVSANITVPSNVTLRGAGANSTTLSANGSGAAVVYLGSNYPNFSNAVSITGGTSVGSTRITVSNAANITVGSYLVIDQLNDGVIVTNAGSEGTCTWCDGGQANGTYSQGQIVEVEGVSGTTIAISPALYTSYTLTPLATPFTATKYAGVESLQIYATNSGYAANFQFYGCAYCWVNGVEGNYSDGDHIDTDWSYHGEIVNSYFSNAYLHTPGSADSCVNLRNKSTGMLVQNNILERLHVSLMLEWGAAGNVIAYNYTLGNFDSGSPNVVMGAIDMHGAHPQFNLFEGNDTNVLGQDNIWGSHANNTSFRNYIRGTTKACNPTTGRATVTCSGTNGWWEFQASRAVNVTYEGTNFNLVGDVVGSPEQSALLAYGNPISLVNQAVAVCGVSPCGPGSRSYDNTAFAYTFGYGEASDTGSSGYDSLLPFSTLLLHGEYSNITSSVTWATGLSQVLPPSFYLTAKPSWWGSTPFPAIGADVTGGSGAGGHAYPIPAEVCYASIMGGTDGTGSPLGFNAAACYGASTGSAPVVGPVAPTNVNAITN